jgi:hypothetical protein
MVLAWVAKVAVKAVLWLWKFNSDIVSDLWQRPGINAASLTVHAVRKALSPILVYAGVLCYTVRQRLRPSLGEGSIRT